MAVRSATTGLNTVAPALPNAPVEYKKGYLDKLNNILRLYFNQLDTSIRNAMATQVPYNLQVSQGSVAGATSLYKFGYNADVDATEETIWNEGGNYAFPASAAVVYLSSSSAADTSAGTGARTVTVEGLNASYVEISETVALNGQTQVATSASFLRINRAFVVTAGSGGTSAGVVYVAVSGVSSGVPTGVVYGNLGTGNQTQLAVYTVPANKTLYIDTLIFTGAMSTATEYATAKFNTRELGGTFRTRVIETIQSNSNLIPFAYPLSIPEKTDIECRAIASAANNEISASFEGVLIDTVAT
jgi:hypothetical protein